MDGCIDITWLGHSTVVVDLDRVRVLTDPLLRANAGPLRALRTSPRRPLRANLHSTDPGQQAAIRAADRRDHD